MCILFIQLVSQKFIEECKIAHTAISKKIVEREISEVFNSVLREHGFSPIERRCARRYSPHSVDVIQIEFFDKHSQLKWGNTPYSFALPIGIFFSFMPPFSSPTISLDSTEKPQPEAVECHIRGTPKKGLLQRECEIPNVWYVDLDGKQLDSVLKDARNSLVTHVIPWFDRFVDLHKLLEILEHDPDEKSLKNDCWGWGRLGSPIRSALTGFVAFEIGEWDIARKYFRSACQNGRLSSLAGSKEIDEIIANKLGIAEAKLASKNV